jgi:hypothetical protein
MKFDFKLAARSLKYKLARFKACFVSGHDFSRAETASHIWGFSPWVLTTFPQVLRPEGRSERGMKERE